MDEILCMDIGGSKLLTGAISKTGELLFQRRYTWQGKGNAAILEQLLQAFADLTAQVPQWDRTCPLGMTIPGFADSERGMWCSSSFLEVKNLSISEAFFKEYGISVALDNDANACAIAEKQFGGWSNTEDFLYMTVSNSIGAAFFTDGRLCRGSLGMAGEIGLLPTTDLLSSGYQIRPLEQLASGRGLSQNYCRLSNREEDIFWPADRLQAMAIQGDLAAAEAFRLEARYLARGIAQAAFLLNPTAVILGGGVMCTWELLKPALTSSLREEMASCPKMLPKLAVTKLGYSGALIGAGALALAGSERM